MTKGEIKKLDSIISELNSIDITKYVPQIQKRIMSNIYLALAELKFGDPDEMVQDYVDDLKKDRELAS